MAAPQPSRPLASSRSVCEPAPPSARAMGCGCSGGADSVEKTASCHSDQLRDSSKAGNSREPRRFTASRVRRLAASSAARSDVGGREAAEPRAAEPRAAAERAAEEQPRVAPPEDVGGREPTGASVVVARRLAGRSGGKPLQPEEVGGREVLQPDEAAARSLALITCAETRKRYEWPGRPVASNEVDVPGGVPRRNSPTRQRGGRDKRGTAARATRPRAHQPRAAAHPPSSPAGR